MTKNKFYSPLRYPGGKNRLSNFIASVCEQNDISGHYIEPYAGGAAVAFYLLMSGKMQKITINDFDVALYAFWHSVLYRTEDLCSLINSRPIDMDTWNACRGVLANKNKESDLLELGYATLFLNRTNYSGVLNGGVIGGKGQAGKYKMDCRFNKVEIVRKIREISKRKADINLENLDALELIKRVRKDKNTIFYFDPPYYLKGPSLYMNHYKHNDHRRVSDAIKKIKNARWIVSYDDTDEISELYVGLPAIRYSLSHSVSGVKKGMECIFVDPKLAVDLERHPLRGY